MIAHADRHGEEKFGTFMELAWQLLARVQSELIPCERGLAKEIVSLPSNRHSAICISEDSGGNGTLHVGWTQRKNKPNGSCLKRPCTCASGNNPRCIVHRMDRLLHQTPLGRRIFPWKEHEALKKLRTYLAAVGVQNADLYTFKAFRRGRAKVARGWWLHFLRKKRENEL